MKRLKMNDDTLDLLSALPDSLVHHILSFLGMRSIARTAILSKRLKYLWITTPVLQFTDYYKDFVKFRNFVNRALMLWRGTYLRRFSIRFLRLYSASDVSSDMDSWALFAMERKVEEFYIERHLIDGGEDLFYDLPQCIYESSTIRKLVLNGCNLQNCGNVQWDRLNCLHLSGCLVTEVVINQVVSSSPQLETLSLSSLEEYPNMNIRSSNLKKLLIYYPGILQLNRTMITIWAPNLEAMEMVDIPFKKCLLTDVSLLTKLSVRFLRKLNAEDGEVLCQIIPAIQHAVTVELSVGSFKKLGVMKGKYSFSPLLNVKLLKIDGGFTELSELVCLVEIFPKLEMLVIHWFSAGKMFKCDADSDNNILSEANILKSNTLQLRTVKIIWSACNPSIFQFIEFLLKHATMIEKIVIAKIVVEKTVAQKRRSRVVEAEIKILAAQKVVSLQRSFPSVELVLC